jgi:hypothetical protein
MKIGIGTGPNKANVYSLISEAVPEDVRAVERYMDEHPENITELRKRFARANYNVASEFVAASQRPDLGDLSPQEVFDHALDLVLGVLDRVDLRAHARTLEQDHHQEAA